MNHHPTLPPLSLTVVIFSLMTHGEGNLHLWLLIWIIFDHCCPIAQCNIKTPTSLTFKHFLDMNHLSSWSSRGESLFLFPPIWQLNLDSVKLNRFMHILKNPHIQLPVLVFDVYTQKSLVESTDITLHLYFPFGTPENLGMVPFFAL